MPIFYLAYRKSDGKRELTVRSQRALDLLRQGYLVIKCNFSAYHLLEKDARHMQFLLMQHDGQWNRYDELTLIEEVLHEGIPTKLQTNQCPITLPQFALLLGEPSDSERPMRSFLAQYHIHENFHHSREKPEK